jgi:uncharacterized protein (TIGR02246 family)
MTYSPVVEPQDIAKLFVEAWARRDADKLASLFDEDTEFVNVTGLWWHDREAIRKAHAYGFANIFGDSTLSIVQLRVKSLSPDAAVVHAKLRLEGQTATEPGTNPARRQTILSFVVHRRGDAWSCASAQNTDIVPHMETNLVEPDGTFRSVRYRP